MPINKMELKILLINTLNNTLKDKIELKDIEIDTGLDYTFTATSMDITIKYNLKKEDKGETNE